MDDKKLTLLLVISLIRSCEAAPDQRRALRAVNGLQEADLASCNITQLRML
jgi:hypothetical protein